MAVPLAQADHDYPHCSPELPATTICTYKIEKLHPTQPDVGKHHVKLKRKKFEDLSKHDLEKVKFEKRVPVIIGPDGNLYLVDHHHTSLALWEAGEKDVYVQIKENWSDLAEGQPMNERMIEFWEKMKRNKNCYLKNAKGVTLDPLSEEFPTDLSQCRNNKLRSVASMLIDDGVMDKQNVNFFEFKIAEDLRTSGIEVKDDDYDQTVKEAKTHYKTTNGKKALQKIIGPACGGTTMLQAVISPP